MAYGAIQTSSLRTRDRVTKAIEHFTVACRTFFAGKFNLLSKFMVATAGAPRSKVKLAKLLHTMVKFTTSQDVLGLDSKQQTSS